MKLRYLNLKYAFVNISYLLLMCGTLGYAYNFLSQSGFDDATTGLVITAISLIGVFVGPLAGDIVDRSSKITQKLFITCSICLTILLVFALIFVPSGSPLIIPIVIIAFTSGSVGMPLLNGMAFIYEKEGGYINYGLCRGLGSLAWAAGSNILGRLWSGFGRAALPYYILVAAVLVLVSVQLMPPVAQEPTGKGKKKEEGITIIQFFGKYRSLFVVVAALILMYFCHFIINTFMAKVVGMFVDEGVETVQGNALSIAALVELPIMFGFSILLNRLNIKTIMVLASVLYSLKHVLTAICFNVPMFYGTMLLQMVSYAALVPAVVYFANEYVDEADRNKGQAVFAASSSIGGLLASSIGGWLFTFAPVRAVLIVGAIASCAGTFLMMVGVRQAQPRH